MNLVYTVAIDPPGCSSYRNLAKLLAASLLRTAFSGQIIIIRNSLAPLYLIERQNVAEIFVNEKSPGVLSDESPHEFAWSWKYRSVDLIKDPEQYDKILFLDADCMVLRNIDHLFELEGDIIFQREAGMPIQSGQFCGQLTKEEMTTLRCDGVNSGSLMVSGNVFSQVMHAWRQLDSAAPVQNKLCRDQASWNRLLLDTELDCRPFPEGEVMFPMHTDPNFRDYRDAAILHYLGVGIQGKTEFGFGTYMGRFFSDPTMMFFHLIDS